jgi:hypothetical protein
MNVHNWAVAAFSTEMAKVGWLAAVAIDLPNANKPIDQDFIAPHSGVTEDARAEGATA